jgi:hypothetical protein
MVIWNTQKWLFHGRGIPNGKHGLWKNPGEKKIIALEVGDQDRLQRVALQVDCW